MEPQQDPSQERPALPLGQSGNISAFAPVLNTLVGGAVTIAQLIEVAEDVVDSAVVFATPGAARLFGVGHPEDLVGCFISQIHHPHDALVTRQYTLARYHNEWAPNFYPMRILRGPSQDPIPVIKHVRQIIVGGVMTWITLHTPFDLSQPFSMPVTSAMLERAGTLEEQQLLGRMHVHHMDHVLRRQDVVPAASLSDMVRGSQDYATSSERSGSLYASQSEQRGATETLETVQHVLFQARIDRPHYVCLKCGWPWYGKQGATRRPKMCPNCQDNNWDRPYLSSYQRASNPREDTQAHLSSR